MLVDGFDEVLAEQLVKEAVDVQHGGHFMLCRQHEGAHAEVDVRFPALAFHLGADDEVQEGGEAFTEGQLEDQLPVAMLDVALEEGRHVLADHVVGAVHEHVADLQLGHELRGLHVDGDEAVFLGLGDRLDAALHAVGQAIEQALALVGGKGGRHLEDVVGRILRRLQRFCLLGGRHLVAQILVAKRFGHGRAFKGHGGKVALFLGGIAHDALPLDVEGW